MILEDCPAQKFSMKTSKKRFDNHRSFLAVRLVHSTVVHAHRPKKISVRRHSVSFGDVDLHLKTRTFRYKIGLDLQMMLVVKKRRWRRWPRFRYLLAWLMMSDTSEAEFQREINKAWIPKLEKAIIEKYEKYQRNRRRGGMRRERRNEKQRQPRWSK